MAKKKEFILNRDAENVNMIMMITRQALAIPKKTLREQKSFNNTEEVSKRYLLFIYDSAFPAKEAQSPRLHAPLKLAVIAFFIVKAKMVLIKKRLVNTFILYF